MYGEASLAETAFGEGIDIGVPIIPEVTVETKTLVFVVELDLLRPAEGPPSPPPPEVLSFDDGTLWSDSSAWVE